MARTLITLSTTAALALMCTAAVAETTPSKIGTQSCGQWLRQNASNTADSTAARGWILGYIEASTNLTDTNRAMKGLPASQALNGMNDAVILALVERFCRGKPQQTLTEAVRGLEAQLLASDAQVVRSSARIQR